MNFDNSLDHAKALDAKDPLKHFRQKFHLPQHEGKDSIYFTGNSLGLQPKGVREAVDVELEDWANLGVEGHFHGHNPWFSYHERFPELLAPIIGALPSEVVVMNQLTVNLHLLLASFYRPQGKRNKIICEAKAFPSDLYAFETQAQWHGQFPKEAVVEVGVREGEYNLRTEDILAVIERHKDEVAVIVFGGVNYYSGQVLDMETITTAGHQAGAYVGFDLAHAAGNIELKLHDWNVDFACWCSYKYLNSGPGGVAGVYIHERYASDRSLPRLGGWWGHDKETRFLMQPGFSPIPTAEGWQLSNAPVLSMAVHKVALDLFAEAGMEALLAKSAALTRYLHETLNEINEGGNVNRVQLITPTDSRERGCQASLLVHEKGKMVFNTLIAQGVIADWREPNVIRIAPVPMYNSFEDIWHFGNIIRSILQK